MKKEKEDEESLVPRDYWTPRSLFNDVERAFDDFRLSMRDFWLPSIRSIGTRIPAIDVIDRDEEYVIEAELPGMTKEDVEIEIVESGLSLSAKKEESREEKNRGYLRRERGYVSFRRLVSLPEDSNLEAVEARLEDGVLRVVVPKKERPKEEKKTVEVK